MSDTTAYARPQGSVPRRRVFETTDLEAGHAFMNAAYGSSLRMSGTEHNQLIRHARYDLGTFCLDDVTLSMDTGYNVDPLQRLAVVQPRTGWVEHECEGVSERVGAGDSAVIAPPEKPFGARAHNLEFGSVVLDVPLLEQVAGTAQDPRSGPLRFTGLKPTSPDSADRWRNTVDHVRDVMDANPEAMGEPLVLGNTARLLAAGALETFPNTAAVEPTSRDTSDATPSTVRRAIAFIENNADRDIGLTDIAAAIAVSPHALRFAFARHHDMSLRGQLCRVRMDRAHFDLLAADAGAATVAGIAARWGFARPGCFSALYHDLYGASPADALAI